MTLARAAGDTDGALPLSEHVLLHLRHGGDSPSVHIVLREAEADSAAIEKLAAKGGKLGKDHFGVAVSDFYLTNPIARASQIMARLSAMHAEGAGKATGTHG